MGLFDDLARRLHVLLEGMMRRVDHHRARSDPSEWLRYNSFSSPWSRWTAKNDFGINFSSAAWIIASQHCRVGIVANDPGELDDDRRMSSGRATKETVDLLHVGDVERSQGIAARKAALNNSSVAKRIVIMIAILILT